MIDPALDLDAVNSQLRATLGKLEIALGVITESIVWTDEEGRIQWCNATFGALIGRPPLEILGSEIIQILPLERNGVPVAAEDHPFHLARRASSASGVFDFRQPAKISLVEVSWGCVAVEEGRRSVVLTIREIPKHKIAERRLSVQYATISALSDSSTLSEALDKIIPRLSGILEWQVGTIWEVDAQAHVLRCVKVWHDPSVSVRVFEKETLGTAFASGVGLPGRVWSTGQPHWISDIAKDSNFPRSSSALGCGLHGAIGFPIQAGNEIVGVMEFFNREICFPDDDLVELLDATGWQIGQFIQRKRAEEARLRLAAILESSDDAVVGTSLDGEIAAWNRGAEKLYGYGAGEILGKPLQILLPEESWDELSRIKEWLRQNKGAYIGEAQHVRKGGDWVHVVLTLTPIKDSSGTVTGASLIGRDITRQRKAEEALRHSQEQLFRAQKMDAVGRLAGGVAHDFNNLLTVIAGYARLLIRSFDEQDPRRQDAEEIMKTTDRASSLTRQLLAFSRKQVLEPRIVNLNAILADMGKMLRRLIGEDIELVMQCQTPSSWVKVDPGQIEQVIMNLVVNARDAIPRDKAKGTIIIETKALDADEAYAKAHPDFKPGPYVLTSVSDNGVGMDKKTLARIFEPFFTTKERGEGTGLGLSTVYGIVQQSGGYIDVYSEPGIGSTFKFCLPRASPEDEVKEARAVVKTQRLGSETILLVEDEEAVRRLTARLLRETGYVVLEASNGPEALKLAERHPLPIHLLLTDVIMPKMSGRDVAKRLVENHPETKVLYVSGYTEDIMGVHGILDPGIAFLHKPFIDDMLNNKVREVLDNQARADSGRPNEKPPQP